MDKHADSKRLWELDLAACKGNAKEAAKRWEYTCHANGIWHACIGSPLWLFSNDYRRRADAPPLVEPQPEFSLDWKHGWQTRDGLWDAEIVCQGLTAVRSIGVKLTRTADGYSLIDQRFHNGRSTTGEQTSMDLINKPAPKRKVSCWLVMAINLNSGDCCAWTRDTQQEGLTLVRELAVAPIMYSGAWGSIHGPEEITREV